MLEDKLKKLIITEYGSLKSFAKIINIPYTTIDSILKRGITNSNINNVIKIFKKLGLDVDKTIDTNNLVFNNKVTENDIDEVKNIIQNSDEFTDEGKKSLTGMIDYFHSMANKEDKKD